MRNIINLNKCWSFVKENVGIEALSNTKGKRINLPHTWNNLDGQDGGGNFYRGVCWYTKLLNNIKLKENEVAYLEFEGAHSIVDVYLNGQAIAHHEGGFSTFRVRIDGLLKDKNVLAVSVDNRENDYVYPQWADFTFFGGIYRNVNLIITDNVHFDLDYYGGPGITVTPTVNGNDGHVEVVTYISNYNNEEVVYKVLDK